ncbi:hypothetical protein GUITHDRAFT_166058 [Guillardia theta CCMP2712]|uniref:Uncharacterized protein n=1 Tax=Guillardia theta (strain CCMP2712) TaxID=905079 RepID=L1IGE4_GUITC|nr:hypothetical protein GUITHDRAFT_166058 [Guillardia theta CCMP2712]EKX35167.1 hypothetical protein GUITHDRAFT_166058 [Guillardia theta CCMP2712]|eukprot:XP_005822147.1 hypothetical protein GUITHDRAFT_166058 [Guillardia theta CCMP2712]
MQTKLLCSERVLLALVASTVAFVVLSATIDFSHPRPAALRDSMSTLPQFTQEEGEMKAHENFYESEGSSPSRQSSWTGNGGAAFKYLQHEASNPVTEAEEGLRRSLRGRSSSSDRVDLYGAWGSSRRRHRDDYVERLRKLEQKKRERRDSDFFAGVTKAFGKKEGNLLMNKFDPQRCPRVFTISG